MARLLAMLYDKECLAIHQEFAQLKAGHPQDQLTLTYTLSTIKERSWQKCTIYYPLWGRQYLKLDLQRPGSSTTKL